MKILKEQLIKLIDNETKSLFVESREITLRILKNTDTMKKAINNLDCIPFEIVIDGAILNYHEILLLNSGNYFPVWNRFGGNIRLCEYPF